MMKFIKKILPIFLILFSSNMLKGNFVCLKDMIQNGTIISGEKINIKCGGTLSGTGVLKAPEIVILAKLFQFSGTIDCSKKCLITVAKAFNKSMFTKKGEGQITIKVISEKEIDKLMKPEVENLEKLRQRFTERRKNRQQKINF